MLPIASSILLKLQGLPWGYIYVGTLAAFAFGMHGLCRLQEWNYKNKVKDKLIFSTANLNKVPKNDLAFRLGFALHNAAEFPIQFEITSLKTDFGEDIKRKRIKEQERKKIIDIPANGKGWFNDEPIELSDFPASQAVYGYIEASIKYGRPNKRKYEIEFKKNIDVWFDDNKNFRSWS